MGKGGEKRREEEGRGGRVREVDEGGVWSACPGLGRSEELRDQYQELAERKALRCLESHLPSFQERKTKHSFLLSCTSQKLGLVPIKM